MAIPLNIVFLFAYKTGKTCALFVVGSGPTSIQNSRECLFVYQLLTRNRVANQIVLGFGSLLRSLRLGSSRSLRNALRGEPKLTAANSLQASSLEEEGRELARRLAAKETRDLGTDWIPA